MVVATLRGLENHVPRNVVGMLRGFGTSWSPQHRGGDPIYKYIGIGRGVTQAPLPLPLTFINAGKTESKKMEDGVRVIEFFMPMKKVPTITHQQKQVTCVSGKPVFYEPEELKVARAKLMAHLGQHVPGKKYTKVVRLTVKWCFPITGKHQDGEYKYTKPDTDNLQKLLKDCMTDCGYWKDDALVASEIVEKFWARMPGIYIRIEAI